MFGTLPLVAARALFVTALALTGGLLVAAFLATFRGAALVALLRLRLLAVLILLLLLFLILLLLILLLLLRRLLLFFLLPLPLRRRLFAFGLSLALAFTGIGRIRSVITGSLALIAGRPRRRILGLPRGGRGVDLERLPAGVRNVWRLRPRVDCHGAVLEHAPRPRPEPLGNDPRAPLEEARLLLGKQRDARLDRAAAQTRLDADAGQREIGVEGPHANRDWCAGRHPCRRLPRLLDRHLRREIRDHLDPMLHRLDDLGLPGRPRRGPRPKHEPIEGVRRARAFGIHLQRKRLRHPRQVVRLLVEREIVVTVAVEVDPSRVEWLVTFGDDGHLRSLHGADVSLPLDGLRLPAGVGRIVVANLPHEQRWRIDDRDPHRFAAGIAGRDHDLHRLVEAPRGIGEHDGESLDARRFGG